jgi:hypothetical protein
MSTDELIQQQLQKSDELERQILEVLRTRIHELRTRSGHRPVDRLSEHSEDGR